MLYSFIVFLLSALVVNKDYQSPPEGIEIFVSTNDRHTFFILPVKNRYMDFKRIFPAESFLNVDSSFTHISFGWGDRAYYTEAEDWNHLNIRIILQAALLPTNAAMHVDYYTHRPFESSSNVPLLINENQYMSLLAYVLGSFFWDNNFPKIIEGAHRYETDNFYEATGSYHLFFTSNNWASEGLKSIGIRAPVWSPLEEPVMKQVRKAN
jgi:uncharacterized protein (TIGR02117 family)